MIVGIDLGTTNSLIGIWTEDGARLIPNSLGELLTPSAVGLTDDGEIIVGQAARERMMTRPAATTDAFKRYMGSEREARLSKRSFRPEELSALVLRSLIADVEAATGTRPTEAVISVPAYFSDAQRKATRNAGELAGIRVERLINEPTAAALAYGLQEQRNEAKFLVFDLGGGTFDVSILEKFEGIMEVHASAGDNFLGGKDFDDLLLDTALADLRTKRESLSPEELAQARHRIERAKCRTGGEIVATLNLGGGEQRWTIDDARFETLAAPLLQRMRTPLERALRDSRTRPEQLDAIVLVGGASRMPMVGRLVTRMFGRLPLRHINPDQAIAMGAAVMAGMKSRHHAFEEVVMTDVCPYTLGVEVARVDEHGRSHHGLFSPIIERNTVIPASRVERYVALADHQDTLELKVFQGESPRVSSNIALGQLDVPLPRMLRHEMPVDVRFTYDVNGLLEVEAVVLPTGKRHQVVIERNPGLLSPLEIQRRLQGLSALKTHPRDQQANLALISRAERLYEESLGEARALVANWLTAFMAEVESQDLPRIERARRQLQQRLDAFEQDQPL